MADPRRSRPPDLKAMADRLRDGLDANAAMVAQAARECGEGNDHALRDHVLRFCQHALQRDDICALAHHNSSLANEFRSWLGDDLIAHIRLHILPRSASLPRPPLMADARLIAHARRHGWLAPTTLALSCAGSPAPKPRTPATSPETDRRSALVMAAGVG
ncbi:MAG: hypothetical protein Q4G22_13300 [Paracoccus sp. (in: a-proteobacteria)]|uniref:hypothetical protein n=1 Tax=Paracoccus sp. TaxID=267 RepID=UPI0026DF94FE|nr:hypothetical protein [Paracoccus sp. (in: a-proteobacteria)]MDO5632795.1 hypothetical protein [Paracoccus sp. (in: a-proteobacteria)]